MFIKPEVKWVQIYYVMIVFRKQIDDLGEILGKLKNNRYGIIFLFSFKKF